jgi:hypothetical protein
MEALVLLGGGGEGNFHHVEMIPFHKCVRVTIMTKCVLHHARQQTDLLHPYVPHPTRLTWPSA